MNDNSVKPAPIESVNNSEGANGALSVEKPVLIPIEGEEKFDPEAGPVAPSQPSVVQASYLDIFKQFVWMGWTAFGGPAAHIALFQKVFVDKLRWMSTVVFLELLALSQCMPGPSSTQVSFAIGVVKRGIPGGLLSGVLFQYPGFLIMSLVGVGAANWLKDPEPWLRGIISGLAAVGVALVASAAKQLTKGVCKDKVTMVINTVSAVVVYYYTTTWIFAVLIFAGGLITLYTERKNDKALQVVTEHVENLGLGRIGGGILCLMWAVGLVLSIVLRKELDYESHKPLYWWEVFYRTGSLIFGGGQVVLPILYNDLVQSDCTTVNGKDVCTVRADSWMTADEFYTGLAVVQAMPGPLFNIAAYCGAVLAKRAGIFAVTGIVTCWVGLFAPGILLVYGILPFWGSFRRFQVYRRMLPGLNSAAVGLVVAAVFQLTFKLYQISPFPNTTICIGIIGYALTDFLGCPAPAAIILGGLLGLLGWGADMH